MIPVEIPGRGRLEIDHVVFDFNGTIAVDGRLISGVRERLKTLAQHVCIHVLTADTYGTVEAECSGMGVVVDTFTQGAAGEQKRAVASALDGGVVCFGNGFNDIAAFDEADIAIAVIEGEGACAALLAHADIVSTSICDGIDMLLETSRLKATLRW